MHLEHCCTWLQDNAPGWLPPVQCAAASAHWLSFLQVNPLLLPLIQEITSSSPEVFLSFLLGPSTEASVISVAQEHGKDVVNQICYMTRTWLFTLHRERLKKLGYWVLAA